MKKPVIAIGLDAANPLLLEKWMSQGHLKNLSRLREQGVYTRLNTLEYYRAEAPWTTFMTGCSPQKTGYWGMVKFLEGTYQAKQAEVGTYDFVEYPPFYALGKDYRVAIFDVPQSTLSNQVNGLQVMAWGAHAAENYSHSRPGPLLHELISKYGEHPGLNKDYADTRSINDLRQLQKALETGVSRRSAICQDLLQREKWDLFLTIFGETHAAEHYMWHLSESDHPLSELTENYPGNPVLEVFKAVDQAIGDILLAAPEDAEILIFSAHSMQTNFLDLPSMVFLPEFLYRWSFPGNVALAPGKLGTTPEPTSTSFTKKGWFGDVWDLRYESNPLKRLRRAKISKLVNRLDKFLGFPDHPDIASPQKLREQGDELWWHPTQWYKPLWPQMKAFALPGYSEGFIRINLQGRDPQGIIAPSEYDAVCDELSQHLYRLKDARTGKSMVRDIIRTRQNATDLNPKLPPADLLVMWQEEHVTDVVDSPNFGCIGPVPYQRTGGHCSGGFLLAKGPSIAPGSSLPVGHALDLAPTILELMGAPIPQYYEGEPLLCRALSDSVV